MPAADPTSDPVRIGIVSISDRASSGVYEDKGLPALQDWLTRALRNPLTFEPRLIPDEQAGISATLAELVDAGCALVLTTGGTGPALRDVTPEATLAVADKEMPGFGEQMRQISLRFVPTAILSRQVAVIRGKCLIMLFSDLLADPDAILKSIYRLRHSGHEVILFQILDPQTMRFRAFGFYEHTKRPTARRAAGHGSYPKRWRNDDRIPSVVKRPEA